MLNIVQDGKNYNVTFSYDPYLVSVIKAVPGRRWNPSTKVWTIPGDKLGWFLNGLKGSKYEYSCSISSSEHLHENAELDTTSSIPDIQVTGYTYKVKSGSKPYQHQLDFMKYAIDRQHRGLTSGFLVGDEPGLGKSNEAFNLAMYNKKFNKDKHCLIICCVNTSKYNWRNDISDHSNGKEIPYILGARKRRDGSLRFDTGTKEKLEDLKCKSQFGKKEAELPFFIIMNVESLRAKQGRSYPIADEIIKLIQVGEINTIIIDEIHKNLSPTSIQGKQLLRIKKNSGKKVLWLPMTGTPITNKPTDVFLSMRLVDAHSYDSFYFFSKNYCIFGGFGSHEIVGYKNIPDLKHMLQSNMIRRRKEDVLDLPPKIFSTEYVENSAEQRKLYTQIESEMQDKRTEIVDSLNPLSKFIKLRQVNGSPELVDSSIQIDRDYLKKNAKISKILELVEEIVERGEKVLIFSNWVEPLRTLYKFVSKKYKTCCFTGTMSEADRQKHKEVFQTNPNYKVLVGTIGAMGTTHTFTAAQNVIFMDEPWTPADRLQAIDRCHRIGTKSTIHVYTVITKDTIDERVHNILYDKELTSKYIVDGKLDLRKNPDLFDKLLGNK